MYIDVLWNNKALKLKLKIVKLDPCYLFIRIEPSHWLIWYSRFIKTIQIFGIGELNARMLEESLSYSENIFQVRKKNSWDKGNDLQYFYLFLLLFLTYIFLSFSFFFLVLFHSSFFLLWYSLTSGTISLYFSFNASNQTSWQM